MSRLTEFEQLKAIFWPGSEAAIIVGEGDCVSITVFYETGDMAYKAWVSVEYGNGRHFAYNVAMLEGYERFPVDHTEVASPAPATPQRRTDATD